VILLGIDGPLHSLSMALLHEAAGQRLPLAGLHARLAMHETPQELTTLQELLDRSYATAGPHLRSIHTEQRRLSAEDLADILRGVVVLNLATTTDTGQPIVAPVDGLFLRGLFWFGSSKHSLRFKHIRRDPRVSAAYTQGEEISVLVHGVAHEIDTSSGRHERLHEYCREVYGPSYDEWGYWGNEPFARIDPDRMYAIRIDAADT